MDETSFNTRSKSKKVVALRGSRNVWSKEVTTNFHLSIVACGSADGKMLPPVFIFPGVTVNKTLADVDIVNGSCVTTSTKGFMNTRMFSEWLDFFHKNVDDDVERPLLLIYDGLSSHISYDIIDKCEKLEIVLLCLHANATHLFQPLDICVFGPYKKGIRNGISKYMVENDVTTISKEAGLKIASAAWTSHMSMSNMKSGFRESGLWPADLQQMHARLSLFRDGGLKAGVAVADWLKMKQRVKEEILVLPKDPGKNDKRKTVDVAGRILSIALLREIDKTKEEKRKAAKKSKEHKEKRKQKESKKKYVESVVI
ncbi:hypothetical protein LEN26_020245 [Aphanomyces euteiches]|nr:hypothetical protein LEN26_020245 [Aphanomyces euteiches]